MPGDTEVQVPEAGPHVQEAAVLEAQIQAQRLAGRVAVAAQLQSLVLRELHWTMPDVTFGAGLAINMDPQFELMVAVVPGDVVVYRIRSTIPGTIPDGTEIFRLVAVLQISFQVPPGNDFRLEELHAFGSTSGLLIAFPYIREALQSTAARAGLPALLPAFRLPYVPQPTEPEEA